jgi:ubiquinone/menaquinone biosynthesis C-methylase UbiE
MTNESYFKLFENISEGAFAQTGVRPGGLDLTRRALAIGQLGPGSRLLDVGCGSGVTVSYFRDECGIDGVGIDSSPVLLARGKARDATLPIIMADAAALPFRDGHFHGIILECSLSLVQDPTQVLGECHRILMPSGKLIVSDLYARNPESREELTNLPLNSCLRGAFDRNLLVQQVSQAGFTMMSFEDHSDLLLDFAARMIWAYGSLDQFWKEATCNTVDAGVIRRAVQRARPGYFLFVGRKGEDVPPTDARDRQYELF